MDRDTANLYMRVKCVEKWTDQLEKLVEWKSSDVADMVYFNLPRHLRLFVPFLSDE